MMFRSSRKNLLLPILAALALVGALTLVACSDDDDNATEGEREVSNNDVLNAILFLDGAGLHDIDDAINEDGEIPADALTVARKAETVTRLTAWPSELQASADTLAGVFADMAVALDADAPDLEAAGEAATNAHDAEHDFSHDVWEYLYAEAGVSGGGEDH